MVEPRPSIVVALGALAAAALAVPLPVRGETLPQGRPPIGGVSEDEARRLQALGYADYAPGIPDPDESGVAQLDRSLASPGDTLVVSSIECAAWLIALSGWELHYWKQEDCIRWWSAQLMQNGDLVVNGARPASTVPPGAGKKRPFRRFVARIGWAGELLWLRDISAHHQLDWTPSKEILVLTESQRSPAEVGRRAPGLVRGAEASARFHDNALTWLSADGEVRETLSVLDAVTTGAVEFDFLPRDEVMETPPHVGLFHANSAYAMDQPHLEGRDPLFSRHNVLVTSRNQNRIFVVDRRSRSLVWHWGRDVLQAPHGASWLGNGHFLVFDNGVERGTSRVLEVDPRDGRIVWEYPGAVGMRFHSETRGLAQRLPNGNTLITDSQSGQAFEVTLGGARVWHYFAPVLQGRARRPVLMSLRRYPEAWLSRSTGADPGAEGSVVP